MGYCWVYPGQFHCWSISCLPSGSWILLDYYRRLRGLSPWTGFYIWGPRFVYCFQARADSKVLIDSGWFLRDFVLYRGLKSWSEYLPEVGFLLLLLPPFQIRLLVPGYTLHRSVFREAFGDP